jgi:hypothetical protein
MDKLLETLKDRQQHSEGYWAENYPNNKDISNAEETDNESWEIGFYAGLQFALDKIEEHLI